MIEVNNLRKTFGPAKALVTAVDDVSFSAPDGKITALLGPNGAGKSTTLRVLYTVITPTAGSALIDGINTTTDPLAVRERLGALPHNAGIYERLSARENVRYFGRLNGLQGDELEGRIEALVTQLDMHKFVDRKAKGYSQGQKMKTALARALIHEPNNVVLDEPTNGLDVMATRALRDIINGLKDAGKCILFSSHIMQEVASLCDDLVIIAGGQVRARGSADEIRNQTGCDDLEDAFVAALGLSDDAESIEEANTRSDTQNMEDEDSP